ARFRKITTTSVRAVGGVRRPCETNARTDVVVIFRNLAGVESSREKLRVRVLHGRLCDLLEVVAQSGVDRERWIHLPLVLHEGRVLRHVRMRYRPSGTRAGERLQVARGDSILEVREAAEAVRAEEVTREIVEDPVLIDVEATLHGVAAKDVRQRVGDLMPPDGRLTRAEGG